MRISDLMLSSDWLNNYNNIKSKVDTLATQISTGNKIQQPSDSPVGTASLIRWNNQLEQMNTYSSNIDDGTSYVNDTISTMQSIQNEVSNDLTSLTNISNTTNSGDLSNYADQISSSLQTIISLANTQSDGKYVFGGTDYSSAPYGFSADNSCVQVKVNDVSGVQKINTAQGISQQINMTGTEIFGTIVSQNGSVDSSATVGTAFNSQTKISDAAGNQYTFKTTYTKTAPDTYSMTYDILDGSNKSVLASPPAAKTLVFDPKSGLLQTANGQPPAQIQIKVPKNNIDFTFDPTSVTEASGTSNISLSANQSNDIFNTLNGIVNSLKAGQMPTAAQAKAVSNFNDRIINNIAKAGNTVDQLANTKDLISSQQTQLSSMMSNVQAVDIAKATMNLQNYQNDLDESYKLAAYINTDSLMKYLS
jgi:flagellar hook-associated protein 3 FlgL